MKLLSAKEMAEVRARIDKTVLCYTCIYHRTGGGERCIRHPEHCKGTFAGCGEWIGYRRVKECLLCVCYESVVREAVLEVEERSRKEDDS